MNLAWLRPMYVVGRSWSNSSRQVTPYSQRAIHDQRVHISEARVQKCAGQAADRRKAKLLPHMNRAKIGADDKVELHGAEAVGARVLERMGTHRGRHSATNCVNGCHVAAIAY